MVLFLPCLTSCVLCTNTHAAGAYGGFSYGFGLGIRHSTWAGVGGEGGLPSEKSLSGGGPLMMGGGRHGMGGGAVDALRHGNG